MSATEQASQVPWCQPLDRVSKATTAVFLSTLKENLGESSPDVALKRARVGESNLWMSRLWFQPVLFFFFSARMSLTHMHFWVALKWGFELNCLRWVVKRKHTQIISLRSTRQPSRLRSNNVRILTGTRDHFCHRVQERLAWAKTQRPKKGQGTVPTENSFHLQCFSRH